MGLELLNCLEVRENTPLSAVYYWHKICIEQEAKRLNWVKELKARGIKAAHPDDGWVDRENNEVHFCYPQFDIGVCVGVLVALGHPDKYRIVKLIGERENFTGLVYWKFEEKLGT